MTNRVLVHCNAGLEDGMGHLVRSLAVAEQARQRNWDVTLGGDLTTKAREFAQALIPELSLHAVPAGQIRSWLNETIDHLQPQVVHLDTYSLGDDSITPGDFLVSNMQDGPHGVRAADLVIDANFGSQDTIVRSGARLGALAGISAALIRNQVRQHRVSRQSRHTPPRVLVVLGGTDPTQLTTRVVDALVALSTPTDLTVVCRPDQNDAVHRSAEGTAHRVRTHGFLSNLPALASEHDLIVSAAGSSVWDFACMGVPMALVCAADNQLPGYTAVTDAGLALPLGVPPHHDLANRMGSIDLLLNDESQLARISGTLQSQVDGFGAWRLVSSWEQLLDTAPIPPVPTDLIALPATLDDARVLFEWRNDPATRSVSRSTEPVNWTDHLSWLEHTVTSPSSRLLVVRRAEEPAESKPLGTVRWDRRGNDWEASITAAPAYRGRGLALEILRSGEASLIGERPVRVLAAIHGDNVRSRRLFARAGYLPHLPADQAGFSVYARWLFNTD